MVASLEVSKITCTGIKHSPLSVSGNFLLKKKKENDNGAPKFGYVSYSSGEAHQLEVIPVDGIFRAFPIPDCQMLFLQISKFSQDHGH